MASGLAAGAAVKQGLPRLTAQQQPCPLRAQQALVPRHGNEVRPQLHADLQASRRLGGIQNKRHPRLPAVQHQVARFHCRPVASSPRIGPLLHGPGNGLRDLLWLGEGGGPVVQIDHTVSSSRVLYVPSLTADLH